MGGRRVVDREKIERDGDESGGGVFFFFGGGGGGA